MKVFLILIFLLVASISTQAEIEKQVVYIKCVLSEKQYKICTGFIANVSNQLLIVTCYHALAEAEQLIAITNDITLKKVRLVAYDDVRDIALLSFQNDPKVGPGLKLSSRAPKGKGCLIYGFPSNWNLQELSCHLTTAGFSLTTTLESPNGEPIYRFGYSFDIISISGIVYGGLSGSPVISGGTVIGIFIGSLNEGGSLAWAVPVKYVTDLHFLPSPLSSPKNLPKYDAVNPRFRKALACATLEEIPNQELINSIYRKIKSLYFLERSSLSRDENINAQESDYLNQISLTISQTNSFLSKTYSVDSADWYLTQIVKLIKSTQSIKIATEFNFDSDSLNKLQTEFISLVPRPPIDSGIVRKMQALRHRSDTLRAMIDIELDSLSGKFSIDSQLKKIIEDYLQIYNTEPSALNFKKLLNAIYSWNEHLKAMVAGEQRFYQAIHEFFDNFEERADLVYEARKLPLTGTPQH